MSYLADENPWCSSNKVFGNTSSVCALLHDKKYQRLFTYQAVIDGQEEKVSDISTLSLEMIALQKEISRIRAEIHRKLKVIHQCQTPLNSVMPCRRADRMKYVQQLHELNTYLTNVVTEKELLISRLRHSHISDHLKINASYKRCLTEIVEHLIPILSEVSSLMTTLKWNADFSWNMVQLITLIDGFTKAMGSYQDDYESILQMYQAVNQLLPELTACD